MKQCYTCGKIKTEEAYSWKVKNVKRSGVCKDCHKEYRREHYLANRDKYISKARAWEEKNGGKLAVRYNLSAEQVAELLAKYDSKCWLCQEKPATHIDHNHSCCSGATSCGKCIRGILCSKCNTGLGFLGDNMTGLQRAMKYLSHKH